MPDVEVFRLTIPTELKDRATPQAERLDSLLDRLERRTVHPRVDDRDMRQAHSSAQGLGRALDTLGRTHARVRVSIVDQATAPLRSILSMASSPLGVAGGVAALTASIAWPLKLAGNLERTETSYATFLGNQERAVAFQRDMEKLADVSPFQTEGLERDAVGLLNVSRNAAFTIRTLRAFGDTASATGASQERMSLGLVGFEQIATRGTVSMEDLRQVTENLNISTAEVGRELGLTGDQLANVGTMGISSARGMEAILRVMERAPYSGGMQRQAQGFFGLLSTLRDFVSRNARAFGVGMLEELVPRLRAAVGWTNENAEGVAAWQKSLTELGRAVMGGPLSFVEGRLRGFRELVGTELWRTGTGDERARLFWSRMVTDPFEEWWAGSGRGVVTGISGRVGDTLGRGVGSAVLGGMGAVVGSGPFADAGAEAGRTFVSSFITGVIDSASGGRWAQLRDFWSKVLAGDFSGAEGVRQSIVWGPWGSREGLNAAALATQQRAREAAGITAGSAEWSPRNPPGEGAAARPALPAFRGNEPLTRDQFNDQVIREQFRAAGLDEQSVANACGPIMAAGLASAIGIGADSAEVARYGQQTGFWDPQQGVTNRDEGPLALLAHAGVAGTGITGGEAQKRLARHEAIGINAGVGENSHYFLASGFDPDTGMFDVGSTGTSLRGGAARMSMEQIKSRFGPQIDFLGVDWTKQGPELAAQAAAAHGVDPGVLQRLFQQESGYNPTARSPVGALGIAQFMDEPAVLKRYGITDRTNPVQSITGGAAYVADLAKEYGSIEAAIAAYNGGPNAGRAVREGRVGDLPDETRTMLRTVFPGRGYAQGGVIAEPVVGVGLTSGAGYSFGERGPERVTPGLGGGGVHLTMAEGAVSVNLSLADGGPQEMRRVARAVGPEIMRYLAEQLGGGLNNVAAGVKGT